MDFVLSKEESIKKLAEYLNTGPESAHVQERRERVNRASQRTLAPPRADGRIGWSPETENQLLQPTENPTCPEHGLMVPYTFEPWEISKAVKSGFRCANLTCGIVYIEDEGDEEGFYVLENGELTPYSERNA